MTIDELLAEIALQQSARDNFDPGDLEWQAVNDQLGDLFRQLAEAVEGK